MVAVSPVIGSNDLQFVFTIVVNKLCPTTDIIAVTILHRWSGASASLYKALFE
jgi:hypothetical protein